MSSRSACNLMTAVIASALVLGGCATQSEIPQDPDAVWDLVIIGDSSMWELGEAYASRIEQDVGVDVALHDFALPVLSAGEVLRTLQGGPPARSQLAELHAVLQDAEVVVMSVNPVNSVDPAIPHDEEACFNSAAPSSCEPASFEQWTEDLKAIWAEIFKLRGGNATILRATDSYNPLVDPWKQNGVFESCTECWEYMSDAARRAAQSYGIPFLSRLDAFNGPAHDQDPRQKGFIIRDGIHPSVLGAQFTAELLSHMGYEPVPKPWWIISSLATDAGAG
jgi:hypothetical protein